LKILVTGATGLIGSFITKQLIADGHSVRAMKRERSDLSLVFDIKNKIEWAEGNILDVSSCKMALQDIDAVVHAAAIISFRKKDIPNMFKTNVEGTENLVNLCLQNGVKRFIHISSIAAIGRTTKNTEISENAMWEESSINSHYAKSKYLAELEVWRAGEEGLDVAIVNPSVVLGPGDWLKSSTRIFKYVWDERKFYTEGKLNYVDVRDVSSSVTTLLDNNISGERFILSGGSILYKDFFEKVAQQFNKQPPTIKAGKLLLNIAVAMEYLRSKVTGSEPNVTSESKKSARMMFHYKSNKIKSSFNFEFRPLDETLDWACALLMKKTASKL